MKQSKSLKRRRSRKQAGFSMIELLIGGSVLAVALLGHTASIFSEHRLSESERARSTALLAAEQFMESMRSDDDYAGLFNRLNTLQAVSERSPTAAAAWIQEQMAAGGGEIGGSLASLELTRTLFADLQDGRRAFLPQAYYTEFRVPRALRSLHVAVAVPSAPLASDPTGSAVLREDLQLPQFGLPADLTGDSQIDDASHNDDYRVLPVIVTFRWTTVSGASEEINVSTWLWGNR